VFLFAGGPAGSHTRNISRRHHPRDATDQFRRRRASPQSSVCHPHPSGCCATGFSAVRASPGRKSPHSCQRGTEHSRKPVLESPAD